MNEFDNAVWLGGHILTYNFSGKNIPSKTGFAGTCLTNGCTYGVRGNEGKGIAYYEYRLRKDLLFLEAGYGFWCPFTMDQIIQTLEDINEYVPFKFEITDLDEYYQIKLEVDMKMGYKHHFYIVTRVRYLYEFPQCALYHDAMTLKTLDQFKDQSLTNLYALVVNSITNLPAATARELGLKVAGRSGIYDQYHSIPMTIYSELSKTKKDLSLAKKSSCNLSKFVTEEQEQDFVKNRLRMQPLNTLHKLIRGNIKKMPLDLVKLYHSLEFWNNQEYFDTYRLPYYDLNFRLLTGSNDKEVKDQTRLINSLEKNLSDKETFEALRQALCSKTYLTRSKEQALREMSALYRKWAQENTTRVAEYYNAQFEKNHPRDRFGRFIRKNQTEVEVVVRKPRYRDRFGRFAKAPTTPANELREA